MVECSFASRKLNSTFNNTQFKIACFYVPKIFEKYTHGDQEYI